MRSRESPGLYWKYLAVFLLPLALPRSSGAIAQLTSVRHRESANRGFLVIRNEAGVTVGSGELTQSTHRDRMSSLLVFRFTDGSIDEETTEYSQKGRFRLISYHHIQRGPSFPQPVDASIDMASQQVTTASVEKDTHSVHSEHMDLPEDLSNGLILTLLKNTQKDTEQAKFPYLAFSPKGRLVKLAASKVGQQSFKVGGHAFRADHYTIKVELGGVVGLVAPIIGKQPTDIDVWVATGKVPAIVRLDGALYLGGPILSIQLATPTW